MKRNKEQLNRDPFWRFVLLHKWEILVILLPIFIIISGVLLGLYYSSLPENNPQRDKKSCESIHGKWLNDKSKCLLSYKKAGEACLDGGQCESGVCFPPDLTKEQQAMLDDKLIENITGTCYPENLISGCVKQVVKGAISKETMCFED